MTAITLNSRSKAYGIWQVRNFGACVKNYNMVTILNLEAATNEFQVAGTSRPIGGNSAQKLISGLYKNEGEPVNRSLMEVKQP
jgi:hypothetical protein